MESVLIGKTCLAIVCSLCMIALLRYGFLSSLPERSFDRLMLAGLVLTRLAVFAALYLVLGYEVPSDVQAAYVPEARAALEGKLAYRDFFTTYSPLFPYVAAIPVFFWNSGKSIALLAILLDTVSFYYWSKVYRDLLAKEAFRAAVILYVFNPLYISSVAIAGKNDVWIAAAAGIAVYLLKRNKHVAAGLALAWAFAAVKFSALLPLPAIFAYSRRRWISIASFTSASAAIYGLFLLYGANVFIPLTFQRSSGQDSSGNLPFLLTAFSVDHSSPVYLLLGGTIAASILLLLWRRIVVIGQTELLETGNWALLILLVALLFSKKSFTYYLVWLGFPVCVFVCLRLKRRLIWICGATLFFAVASLEPSLWYRWVRLPELSSVPQLLATGELSLLQLGVFGFCEIILVGGYLTAGILIVADFLPQVKLCFLPRATGS